MNTNSSKESSKTISPSTINNGFPLPYPLIELFCNPSLKKIDTTRIVGRPLWLDVRNANGELTRVKSVLLKDNFMFGALWGLLSGYCTKIFFIPLSTPRTFASAVSHPPGPLKRTWIISSRVLRRITVAGLLFDYVEQYAAKKMNKSHTNTMTIFMGLLTCVVAFPVCSQPLPNAVYSSAVLMGYLAGAKLPSLIDEARRGRDRSK